MKITKRITLLVLALALALSLAACGGASGPEMPMELTVNGHTIVLGQTTTAEMKEWAGWEVLLSGSQSEIRTDAKYVACYYHVKIDGGGAGKEFWLDVYVPFQKNIKGTNYVDLSAEEQQSKTEGVVFRVQVRKSAGKDLSISYNGVDLQDLTWDTAEEWGATVNRGEYTVSAEMTAAQGTLAFAESSYHDGELNELKIAMSTSAFSKLQK